MINVPQNSPAYSEELFGPIAVIIPFKTKAEAVALANQSDYGLGASIWTKNIEKAKELAKQLDVGNVFINSLVKSDPRLPFGGIKKSGYGRELSLMGIREFLNAKTVYVQ